MTYLEFIERNHFSHQELLACAWGNLISDPPDGGVPTLPAPPLLMFDRVVEISHDGNRGRIIAEQDIRIDDWFFHCHFRNDPVQPGCLGVDAVWQLIGLYCGIRGARGSGRALGSKEIEFFGQIRPHNKLVRYEVDIRRYSDLPARNSATAIGSAVVLVDGEPIYKITDAKVGIFRGIRYSKYPYESFHSRGGKIYL